MRIGNIKSPIKSSRIKRHTTGGGKRKAHNIGKTYRNKQRGR